MFPEVHTSLRFDQRLSDSASIHIDEKEDQLGSFMIHHVLSWAVKSGRPIVIVGLEQTFSHFHAVHLKIGGGGSLKKMRESGQLVFVEGLKMMSETAQGSELQLLRKLCSEVKSHLEGLSSPVVIIDKLSLLFNFGITLSDIVAFYQSLDDSISDGCLITLTRSDGTGEDNERLSAYLHHTCDGAISVWPLSTGLSATVTGNIGFDWNGGTKDQGRFQFRVEDKNVRVFALGASVL